jgi:hypothetical protein
MLSPGSIGVISYEERKLQLLLINSYPLFAEWQRTHKHVAANFAGKLERITSQCTSKAVPASVEGNEKGPKSKPGDIRGRPAAS